MIACIHAQGSALGLVSWMMTTKDWLGVSFHQPSSPDPRKYSVQCVYLSMHPDKGPLE